MTRFLRSTLCKYKDIFGKPNEGVHKYRIFNLAIVDIILTILGAILLSKLLSTNFLLTLLILFLLGIFFHWLFCVPTALNIYLQNKLYDITNE